MKAQIAQWAREIVKAGIWIALLAKLFVFDLDHYFVRHWAPWAQWPVDHGLVVGLVGFTLLWCIFGLRKVASACVELALYPALIMVWRPIKVLASHWPLFVAFIPAIHELIVGFKMTCVYYVLFLLSATVIATSQYGPAIVGSCCYLVFFLAVHFASAFKRAYRRNAFEGLSRGARRVADYINQGFLDDPPRPLQKVKGASKTAKRMNVKEGKRSEMDDMRAFYAGNQVIEYVSDRLEQVARSRKPELFLICSIVYTFALTTVVFALIYTGINAIDGHGFAEIGRGGFADFLGASLSRMTASGISGVKPVSDLAVWAYHLQSLAQVAVFTVVVSVLLTTRRERYVQDVKEFVVEIRSIASAMETRLNAAFNKTIEMVEQELLSSDERLVNWFRRSRGLPALSVPVSPSNANASQVEGSQLDDGPKLGLPSTREGFVYPPGEPQLHSSLVDVRDFKTGQKVRDPRTKKVFIVP